VTGRISDGIKVACGSVNKITTGCLRGMISTNEGTRSAEAKGKGEAQRLSENSSFTVLGLHIQAGTKR
jgi:hypothetical protein